MKLVSTDNLNNILSDFKQNSLYYKKKATIFKDNHVIGNVTPINDIPINFNKGDIEISGDIVYLIGGLKDGTASTGTVILYSYNISTQTYTKLADMPVHHILGASSIINGDLYTFGGADSDSLRATCKYDKITNTWTRMVDIPYNFHQGSAAGYGNYAYLLGTNESPQCSYNYRFDPLTNTYSRKANIPYMFTRGMAVAPSDGNCIYLIGGTYSGTTLCRYDIDTDSYLYLADIPSECVFGGACNYSDEYIFITGSSTKIRDVIYRYNIPDDSYKRLSHCPHYMDNTGIVCYQQQKIYFFGAADSNYSNKAYIYDTLSVHITILKPPGYILYGSDGVIYDRNTMESVHLPYGGYYTMYNNKKEIVKNTYPMDEDGNTKIYAIENGTLNGKGLSGTGWVDINMKNYV